MTVMFYAIDTVGVGHLSRLLGIAEALTNMAPSIPIVFISESSDSRLLDEYPYAYHQVPSFAGMLGQGRWDYLPQATRETAWNGIVTTILAAHRPRVFVYDTFIWPELAEIATSYAEHQVLVLRLPKDPSSFLSPLRDTLQQLSLVVLPHDPAEVPASVFHELSPLPVICSGSVLRRSRENMRRDLDLSSFGFQADTFNIVVTNGGGNALPAKADNFPSVVMEALRLVDASAPPFRCLFVEGPLSHVRRQAVQLSHGRILIREYEPYLLEAFSSAHLVISRGGYNTTLELSQIGVPSLCVPARRFFEDQAERLHSAAGLFPNIHPCQLDSHVLAKAIADAMSRPRWTYSTGQSMDPFANNRRTIANILHGLVLSAND